MFLRAASQRTLVINVGPGSMKTRKGRQSSDDCGDIAQPCVHRFHERLAWSVRNIVPARVFSRRFPRLQPCLHRRKRFLLNSEDGWVDGARGRDEVRAMEPVSESDRLLGGTLSRVEVR